MKKTAIYIMASTVFFAACGPVDEWTVASFRDVPSTLYFEAEASSQDIKIEGNYWMWMFEYSIDADWCTVDYDDYYGEKVSVTANTGPARTATIIITWENEVMKTVTVEQAAGSPYVTGNLMVQRTDASPDIVTWTTANILCNNLTVNGYSDWRLPTSTELEIMYEQRNAIGGFKTTLQDIYTDTDGNSRGYYPIYWSSTYGYDGNYYYYVINFYEYNDWDNNWSWWRDSDVGANSYHIYARCVRTR
ncbi:MAG: DUF1566 domain-containing protein [Tannerella sp.]|jgi:hypothetical protein|nr:DUF1566 domain-containing protein [Tannerella sp.]